MWVPFFGERLIPASASKYCYLDRAFGAHNVLQNADAGQDAVHIIPRLTYGWLIRKNTALVTAFPREVSLSYE